VNGQVSDLRPAGLAAPGPRGGAPFALVTGGKGGVGKSTVVANLGLCLAARGLSVLLVDLDLALANLQVLLRVEGTQGLEQVLRGELDLAAATSSVAPGLDLLPAGSGVVELARPDAARRRRLLGELDGARTRYDLLLGDSAAGIGPDVLAFAAAADHVLVVTTPDPAALTDAYGLLKAYDATAREEGLEAPTPELLVNCAADAEEAHRVAERLGAVGQRFLSRRPRCVGWLPWAKEVSRACAQGQAFVHSAPQSLASRALERLADRYQRLIETRRTPV
jgi:flagellar biosynthesis protein FlhG